MAYNATAAALRVGIEMQLPQVERFVLVVYSVHANSNDGLTYAKRSTVAVETGLSESTVVRAVHELVSRGLMVVHAYPRGGRGRSTVYRVLPGEWEIDGPEPIKGVRGRGVSDREKGVSGEGVSDNPEKSARDASTDYPGKSEKGVTEGPKTPEATFRHEFSVIAGGKAGASDIPARAAGHQSSRESTNRPTRSGERGAEPLRGEGTASPSASETSPPWWDTPGVPPELRDTMRRVQARHGPPDVTGEDQPR